MADFAPAPAPGPQAEQALPMAATPEAFGAGVAAAGEQAAASYQQRELQARQILLNNKYDADMMAGQQRLLALQDHMAQVKTAAQTDGTVPHDQYQDHVLGSFDQLAGAVTDGVTNTRIARQLTAQVAEQRSQTMIGAGQFQAAQTAAIANDGMTQLANQYVGNARQYASIDQLQQGQSNFATAVHSLVGVTDADRAAVAEHGIASQATAYFQAKLYSGDPQDVLDAKTAIDNGTASHVGVPGPALETLERLAGIRMRAIAAQQQASQATAQATFTISAQQLIRTADHDGSAPVEQFWQTEQQARQLAADAAARGKPSEELTALADNLHLAGVKIDVNGTYASQPPAQVAIAAQNAQAAIAAKQAAGQAVSMDEGAHATALAALSTRLNSQLQTDPTQLAAAHGIALAPLDPSNPASFDQRVTQMAQLAQVVKSPVPLAPLAKPEAEQLSTQAAASDQGRMTVLAQMDHFDPATRALAARQILPGDPTFATEAQLNSADRQIVQAGKERLQANPGFWPSPTNKTDATAAAAGTMIKTMDDQLAFALQAMQPTAINATQATARNWLAGTLAAAGKADGQHVTQDQYGQALRAALGGDTRMRTGGWAVWGNPQNPVILPENMKANEFGTAVVNARRTDDARGQGPVDRSGAPANLNNATPIYLGNNSYRWQSAGQTIGTRGGAPYITRLAP